MHCQQTLITHYDIWIGQYVPKPAGCRIEMFNALMNELDFHIAQNKWVLSKMLHLFCEFSLKYIMH